MLEDMVKLLTDSDYVLDWPRVSPQGGPTCLWYRTRLKHKEPIAAPEYHNTVTKFTELRERFGSIWSKWSAKREEFGAGFYLYFGTRRGSALYVEHRFVSLIWGLEAFHRSKFGVEVSDALIGKINRIIDQVTGARDKRWLRNRLQNAHEPALSQRLLETFRTLPVGLEEARLRAFSEACAVRRNEVSHFGWQRRGTPRLEFIRDLERKSAVLSTLYHALLLHEIGIDAEILQRWLYKSFLSYSIKVHFVEAGLLDPSVLRPESSDQAGTGQ